MHDDRAPIRRIGTTELCIRWRWLERLAFVAGGRELAASSGWDHMVRIWDVESAQERAAFTALPSAIVPTIHGDAFVQRDGRVAVYQDGSVRWVGTAHDEPFAATVDATLAYVAGPARGRALRIVGLDGRAPLTAELAVPDETATVVADGPRVHAMQGQWLTTYDATTGQPTVATRLERPSWLHRAGAHLAIVTLASSSPRLELRDPTTHALLERWPLPDATAVTVSGDFALLLGRSGARVLTLSDGSLSAPLDDVPAQPERAAIAPSGEHVAWGDFMAPRVGLTSRTTGALHAPTGHAAEVTRVRLAPDGRSLVSCGRDHRVLRIDLASGAVKRNDALRWLDVLPLDDGTALATSFDGVLARLPSDGEHVHVYATEAVRLTPLGEAIPARSTEARRRAGGSGGTVLNAECSQHILASGSVWDLVDAPHEPSIAARFPRPSLAATALAPARVWHTDTSLSGGVAACARTGRVLVPRGPSLLVLDLDTGRRRAEIPCPEGHALTGSLVVDASGRMYGGSCSGRVLVLEDGATELGVLLDVGRPVIFMSLTLVGADRLAMGDREGMVYIASRLDGRLLDAWRAHEASVDTMDASSDGRLLATGSEDTTIALWSLSGHRGPPSLP